MRDEAVASQDQDPTTEPAPDGEAPADKAAAGPSDASETIVSGSHAAGSSRSARLTDSIPAEHDAWEAEFAGLESSGPAGSAPDPLAPGSPAGSAEAGVQAADAVPADEPRANNLPAEEPRVDEPAAPAPASAKDKIPGGHPSVAQRSTLPMRAASTMPDLSRYGKAQADGPDTGSGTGQEAGAGDGLASNAAADTNPADTNPAVAPASDTAEADGGPWYVSGRGNADADASAGQEDVSEAVADEEAQRRSEERERAATAKPVLARIIQVMIAVFFPVMLLAAAIRAVATPVFLWIEYYRPGFPADGFGFSAEDRMTYGSYAVDYLLNFASPRYLGDLVTPDGDPLYLATEVSHMADVKAVLGIAFLTAVGMALLSIAGGIYLARRCPGGIRRALFAGAVATLVLIAGLLVAAVLAWEQFFTQVHSIFFSQGNWTFRLDDTLIRLFPSQFWMDAGGVVAAIVLLVSLTVLVFTWPTKRRRERSRLAREAALRQYTESLEAL